MKVQQGKFIKEQVNFLASGDFKAFTYTVPQSAGEDIDGKKTVKAGTILPANDATAKGILLEDADVTDADAVGSLIESGIILKDRLPVAPAEAAQTALKLILFK